jgi:hypothetical protein
MKMRPERPPDQGKKLRTNPGGLGDPPGLSKGGKFFYVE